MVPDMIEDQLKLRIAYLVVEETGIEALYCDCIEIGNLRDCEVVVAEQKEATIF